MQLLQHVVQYGIKHLVEECQACGDAGESLECCGTDAEGAQVRTTGQHPKGGGYVDNGQQCKLRSLLLIQSV